MTGIYYGDLFIINGKGCVVMGHGKSKTCRNYTGDGTVEVMTDSLRMDCEDGVLVSYGDVLMGLLPFDSERAPKMKVDYFVYMQDADETTGDEIITLSAEEFCQVADFNITFNVDDKETRRNEFASIIQDKNVSFIAVPWGKNMESKGKKISEFIK